MRFIEALDHRRLLAGDPLRFAVVGDYGTNTQEEADVANLIKSWNPAFIATVGDNNYDTGLASTIDANIGQYYHEYIFDYQGTYGAGSATRRFLPSPGNHDWGNIPDNPTGLDPYLAYFNLPGNERYYEMQLDENVRLFLIDSDVNEPDGYLATSVQAQWLQSRLAAANEPHKIVLFHHAPYSSGAAHGSDPSRQWPFAQWGATAVISGHEHSYERLNIDGTPYFVNGLGGRAAHPFATPLPQTVRRFNSDYGAMLLTADATSIRYQFYTRAGTLIDDSTHRLGRPTVALASTTAELPEGGGGVDLTIARSGSTAGDLVVNLDYTSTATPAIDFLDLPQTVTIPDGSASVTLHVEPIDDTAAEFGETLVITLESAAAYNTGQELVTLNLRDDDGDDALAFSGGSTWRYRDTGQDLGTAWREENFNDSSWADGGARFGYGDPGMVTTINGGPSGNRFITHYFRTTFNVPDAEQVGAARLHVLRDDGAVVYLNASELWRTNMPAGTITAQTFASSGVGGADETTFFNTLIDPARLRDGTNRWAVELHQSSITTSDAVFDMYMTARLDTSAPRVRSSLFAFEQMQSIEVNFTEDVAASLSSADLVAMNLTTGQIVPLVLMSATGTLTRAEWRPQTGEVLPDGNYVATIAAAAVNDRAGLSLASTLSLSFFVFAGDANRDRNVNIADFSILASRFNTPGTFSQGDFNYSGEVEIGDFSILASKFNTSLPALPALSEAEGSEAEGPAFGTARSPMLFGTRATSPFLPAKRVIDAVGQGSLS